jgi:P-type conjugative transfer ATPase TrbB
VTHGIANSSVDADAHSLVDDRYADMMARYLGATVMTAFADPDVTEVYANPCDGLVRFDTRSRGRVVTEVHLEPHRLEMFLNAVASRLGATIGTHSARIEAELPRARFTGSRLQGFLPPAVAQPSFTIRKPPAVVYSFADFVNTGSLSPVQRAVLVEAVIERQNIVIAGGTNTGKSTFANAVLREIAERFPTDRIVLLEDTVELQCTATDYVALRTGPGLSLADLVRSALRTSPTRIVVGEVRGAEALDLLDVWVTGHPGGCATVHASSALGALDRLDRLAQRATATSQRALIVEAIQLLVVLEGNSTGRRVAQVARLTARTHSTRA